MLFCLYGDVLFFFDNHGDVLILHQIMQYFPISYKKNVLSLNACDPSKIDCFGTYLHYLIKIIYIFIENSLFFLK